MQDIINGRCGWCGTDELYVKYHDEEWGRLVTDDRTLFEFLVLESSQAGLSWITILKKREGYRKAFCNFDAGQVAQMTDEDVERLMQFEGIVRNRLKIKSTITNARLFLAVQKEFGSFYNYTLSFFPDGKPIVNTVHSLSDIPVSSPQSDAMSKDMKNGDSSSSGARFATRICRQQALSTTIWQNVSAAKPRKSTKQTKRQYAFVPAGLFASCGWLFVFNFLSLRREKI